MIKVRKLLIFDISANLVRLTFGEIENYSSYLIIMGVSSHAQLNKSEIK